MKCVDEAQGGAENALQSRVDAVMLVPASNYARPLRTHPAAHAHTLPLVCSRYCASRSPRPRDCWRTARIFRT